LNFYLKIVAFLIDIWYNELENEKEVII
jgi:hypothetical protein